MIRITAILGLFTLLPALGFSGLVSLSQAQQRWIKTYGGPSDDEGYSVQQTSDGGYIVAGTTASYGNGAQVYLIKTNASGDTLWTKTYGGPSNDEGYSVQQTTDGGYVIAGYTNSYGAGGYDVYLIKTNASGDTLWTRTYGGTNQDYANSVQQTSDGGYIVAGFTNSFGAGNYDVYLIKTNASGDTLWTRTYGGTGADFGNSVRQTSDTGYIVAGYTESFGAGLADFYVIKTKANGDTLWTRTYGGTNQDYGYWAQQTTDGGYIVAGSTSSLGAGLDDVYLIKTNASGDTLWTRTYGGALNDRGYFVRQTSDTGYIVTGYTYSYGAGSIDVYLIKTNASGDTLWTRTYGGAGVDVGNAVQQASDGGYILAGFTTSFGAGGYDAYLIKTDGNGNVGVETPVSQLHGSTVRPLRATPNPFTSFATLPGHEREVFSLYDVSGRMVGTFLGNRIGEGLAAGVYFLRSSDSKDKPLRVVKVR
jgi:hypothetical protein